MDKYQQEEHGHDAVEEQVAWHTVGIVSGSGDPKWLGIGTGCAIRWHDQDFILRADHVIRDTDPRDLRFFFRAPGALNRKERSELLELKGVATKSLVPFRETQIGEPIRFPELDIAAIPVNRQIEHEPLVQFFRLNEGGQTPPEGSQLIIMGFPHDISRLTTDDERVAFTSIEWTDVHPNQTNLDRKFDPDRHFLSRYYVTEEHPDAEPHGFSGAGVWTPVRVPPPAVWYPKLALAGLTIGYYRTSTVLQSIRREIIEDFLIDSL